MPIILFTSCSRGGNSVKANPRGTTTDQVATQDLDQQQTDINGGPSPILLGDNQDSPGDEGAQTSMAEGEQGVRTESEQPDKPESFPLESVREIRPPRRNDQILSMQRGARVYPDDYEIGPLQPPSEDLEQRKIIERIYDFARQLSAGELPLDHILPEELDAFRRSLGNTIESEKRPSQIRIGWIDHLNDNSARAYVRFFGNPGNTAGEIYLDRSESEWYVSDLQVDFSKLTTAPQEQEELFEPSSSNWLNLP